MGPVQGDLGPRELARYSRHLVLAEVGLDGQRLLRQASVLVVGAGGLGCPASLYLVAAGVGRLGLVDCDAVEESNLQRQILYGTQDVGRPKLEAAHRRLSEANPHVEVTPHAARLNAANALEILGGYDVIVDGSDNFPTRYLVNDACVLLRKPDVYGSIFRFEGQASIFAAAGGPCYRCLFPEPPPPGAVPDCAAGGVIGVLPGLVGIVQATEAIKLILGRGEPLVGRLLLFDALEMSFREVRVRRDPDCSMCGDRPTRTELVEETIACAVPAPSTAEVDPVALSRRLRAEPRPVLLDVRNPAEWAVCRIEGARLIPLPELARRIGDLERSAEIVVYCHHGMRGEAAVELLRRNGFASVANLAGGIDAWAATVDPAMPRY